MGKTASDKRSAGAPTSGTDGGADTSGPQSADSSAQSEPAAPLERARLQAEVARQRVRIAKEELKRARKRMKEAKREAKRARKQAAATRKAWKKARRAHRANPAGENSAGAARPRPRKEPSQTLQRAAGSAERKSGRRGNRGARKRRANGNAPVTQSSET